MNLHASCVAFGDMALLITGASGAGKSALALQLIGRGALLVADDRVILSRQDAGLFASCPPPLSGIIEARGIGILKAPAQETARLACVVDLDIEEPDRLPPQRKVTILGVEVDQVFGKNTPNLADALQLYLRNGRYA